MKHLKLDKDIAAMQASPGQHSGYLSAPHREPTRDSHFASVVISRSGLAVANPRTRVTVVLKTDYNENVEGVSGGIIVCATGRDGCNRQDRDPNPTTMRIGHPRELSLYHYAHCRTPASGPSHGPPATATHGGVGCGASGVVTANERKREEKRSASGIFMTGWVKLRGNGSSVPGFPNLWASVPPDNLEEDEIED
ncbi:hypothetical protein V494_00953 [Pseudogymnoascus sp. VKM F-4513 (FW-928)]|nr:hypothetical protein V494_00953 [Pseudogymnoascus sp. VKM F-4513 (FW-928)]